VRLPRRVFQKIKQEVGGRAFFAYFFLTLFVTATPLGVFLINPAFGFISLGATSLVAAWILGSE